MSSTSHADALRVDDRVALVTGGSSGIGQGAALALRDAGADVFILDRNAPAVDHGMAFVETDIADPAAIKHVVQDIAARRGRIDILVNSAGIAIRKPAIEHAVEDWNAVLQVNLTGSFLCAREVAAIMIRQETGGSIVNVASIMGLSGGGLYPNISYQTSKGAIVNMTRALAVEWAPHRIRVNAVAPTYVNTPFIAPITDDPELVRRIEAMTPLRRLAEVHEVASAILFLASDAAAMVTGHTLPVDGGFLAQ